MPHLLVFEGVLFGGDERDRDDGLVELSDGMVGLRRLVGVVVAPEEQLLATRPYHTPRFTGRNADSITFISWVTQIRRISGRMPMAKNPCLHSKVPGCSQLVNRGSEIKLQSLSHKHWHAGCGKEKRGVYSGERFLSPLGKS